MTIPNFKSPEDWETFYLLFDKNLQCKKLLLDRVKSQFFTDEVEWDKLESHQLDFIDRLLSDILYQVKKEFNQMYPDYSNKDNQPDDEESLENLEEQTTDE